MTAEVWLLALGGQQWLWIQDGLDDPADRAFLAAHPEAVNVTAAYSHALVQHLTDVAAEDPDELKS